MINHEYYAKWIGRSTLHRVVEEVRRPMPGTEQSDAEYALLRKAYYEAYDNILSFLVGKDGISMERMRYMGDEDRGREDTVTIPGVKHFATNARNELLRAATKEDEAVKADEKVREQILAIAQEWESLHGFVGLKLAGYMLIGAADCATDATDTFPAIIDEQGIYLYGHGFHGEKGSYEGTYAGEEYTCADYNQHIKMIHTLLPEIADAVEKHIEKCQDIRDEFERQAEEYIERMGKAGWMNTTQKQSCVPNAT